jgi:hypothetical protein
VIALIASANRDEAANPDPDVLRLAEQEIVWTTNPFVRGVEQLIVECGESADHGGGLP